jgi:hypothetical protein
MQGSARGVGTGSVSDLQHGRGDHPAVALAACDHRGDTSAVGEGLTMAKTSWLFVVFDTLLKIARLFSSAVVIASS